MSGSLPIGAGLWGAARFVPRDERLVRALRPSLWFVLFHAPGVLMFCMLLVAGGAFWGKWGPGQLGLGWLVVRIGLGGALAYAVVGALRWWSRLYVVTDRRVVIVAGVLSQAAADLPLHRVQHVTVTRTLVERVLGLGTVGIATAGADGPAIRMLMLARPAAMVELIRAPHGARSHRGIVVLGLAGGIGAGKSEVARQLAALGCVVVDSDVEARAALDRPDVRETLVRWWGPDVVGEDGRVDRGRVAEIVFRAPAERERLEGLIHPLVRSRRADLITRARGASARAAVIDAPLLFEAGVDAECDAVIWVEASRATRVGRVVRTRGWTEAELDRREKAQWPIERKRGKCRYEISNDDEGDLRSRVEAVLERALSELSGPPA